jgi:oligopeptide transport system substrate-binding protein
MVSPSQRPKKLRLLSPDWLLARTIATQLQAQLKTTLGLELEIIYRPWSEVSAQNKAGNFDLVLVSWLGDFNDPATFVEMLSVTNPENSIGWKSDLFEEAVLAAEKEGDYKKRLEKLSYQIFFKLKERPGSAGRRR